MLVKNIPNIFLPLSNLKDGMMNADIGKSWEVLSRFNYQRGNREALTITLSFKPFNRLFKTCVLMLKSVDILFCTKKQEVF